MQKFSSTSMLIPTEKAGRTRPSLVGRTLPHLPTTYTCTRYASNVPDEDPAKKAQSILASLPGDSVLSKTAFLSAGAGLSVYAISNELYVFNEESIVAIAGFSVLWALIKYGSPIYNEFASNQAAKVSGILNAAREGHKEAVKARIDNVKQLGGVIDVTKQLFEVSKVWLPSGTKHRITARSLTYLFPPSKGNRPS